MTLLTEPSPWRLVATDPPPIGRYVLGANPGMVGIVVVRMWGHWMAVGASGAYPTTWTPTLWTPIPTAPENP